MKLSKVKKKFKTKHKQTQKYKTTSLNNNKKAHASEGSHTKIRDPKSYPEWLMANHRGWRDFGNP